jgi:CheY-like chemotaxis protein
MIIDDDPEFRGELKELLVLSDYQVSVALDVRRAAGTAARLKPDVIVLDIKMEEMSGFDVLDKLKSRPQTRDIPVVVVSAFLTEERDSSLLSYFNVTNYLQKPFRPLSVITEIEAAARGKGRFPAR